MIAFMLFTCEFLIFYNDIHVLIDCFRCQKWDCKWEQWRKCSSAGGHTSGVSDSNASRCHSWCRDGVWNWRWKCSSPWPIGIYSHYTGWDSNITNTVLVWWLLTLMTTNRQGSKPKTCCVISVLLVDLWSIQGAAVWILHDCSCTLYKKKVPVAKICNWTQIAYLEIFKFHFTTCDVWKWSQMQGHTRLSLPSSC